MCDLLSYENNKAVIGDRIAYFCNLSRAESLAGDPLDDRSISEIAYPLLSLFNSAALKCVQQIVVHAFLVFVRSFVTELGYIELLLMIHFIVIVIYENIFAAQTDITCKIVQFKLEHDFFTNAAKLGEFYFVLL